MARVIVLTGTLGVGKTFVADALRDLVVDRGLRCGVIDVDWLCQNDPAPIDDPYNDRLAFANLAAMWPNYVSSGIEYLIVARVVEDPADRRRYAAALPGCDIRIVRLEASARTCANRLATRMPRGPWLDAHLARTNALAERLRALRVEDIVVSNEDRVASEVANEILDGLAW